MATIKGTTNEKVFQLKAFEGLNENPDGDTKLKLGESQEMRNFAVTRDKNLRRRAGTKTFIDLGLDEPITGMWSGFVSGAEVFLTACGGKIWSICDDVIDGDDVPFDWGGRHGFHKKEIGTMTTYGGVHFFGFGGIVYMLNGETYKQWDGSEFKDVHGYRPLVTVAVPPAGGGETMENVNLLCGERRCWISPDGTATTFTLPEKGLASVDYVKDLKTNTNLQQDKYTYDLAAGTVTFTDALPQTVNSYEIGWTMANRFRSQITSMRFSELYNSTQDTRVFLYGDGSNKARYSGIDYDGQPRADYFPDLYEMAVGDANTPITGLIRHYSTLIVFKSHSTYSVRYGNVTLSDGIQTSAFYISPVNRTIGNSAMGQVQLVLNSPRTLFGSECYEWHNSSSYSSNLTSDERQAKRVSDRVYATLGSFEAEDCVCYDDNVNQEYYIVYGNKALVNNYACDTWYTYTDFDAKCLLSFRGELYIGSSDGKVKQVSYNYKNDDGRAIDAYWESGSLAFGADYMRKYAAQLWVAMKPESNGEVYVTVQTDRKSRNTEKVIVSSLATFSNVNFARWSFNTNRQAHIKKLKIKAKKFVFYKLIFESSAADTACTILGADIKVRMTGYAK